MQVEHWYTCFRCLRSRKPYFSILLESEQPNLGMAWPSSMHIMMPHPFGCPSLIYCHPEDILGLDMQKVGLNPLTRQMRIRLLGSVRVLVFYKMVSALVLVMAWLIGGDLFDCPSLRFLRIFPISSLAWTVLSSLSLRSNKQWEKQPRPFPISNLIFISFWSCN